VSKHVYVNLEWHRT